MLAACTAAPRCSALGTPAGAPHKQAAPCLLAPVQRPSSSSQQHRRRRLQAVAAQPSEAELSSSSSSSPAAEVPSTSYDGNGADEDDSRDFAVAMAKIAHNTKAEDVVLLHVAPVVYWTRYMLLCTVFSRPQLNAVLAKITKEAADTYGRRLSQSPSGTAGGWELLDYGDVVLHVMTAEQREYYALEDFYGAAEEVELPFEQAAADDVASWSKKM